MYFWICTHRANYATDTKNSLVKEEEHHFSSFWLRSSVGRDKTKIISQAQPNYLGGEAKDDCGSKPTRQKLARPHSQSKSQAWWYKPAIPGTGRKEDLSSKAALDKKQDLSENNLM
jgi:hypothetical protein